MARVSQKEVAQNKAKKIFFITLFSWLLVLPAIVILQIFSRFLLSGTTTGLHFVQAIINIVSLLGGLYGFLGWIAVIIAAVYWEGKK